MLTQKRDLVMKTILYNWDKIRILFPILIDINEKCQYPIYHFMHLLYRNKLNLD